MILGYGGYGGGGSGYGDGYGTIKLRKLGRRS